MAVNYTVQAQVVDIRSDTPRPEDSFLVDTNVWYWMTYTQASQSARPPAKYQISDYPSYTTSALGAGSKIFHSGLSLSELAHLIERSEYEIFTKISPAIFPNPSRFDKNFRHACVNERIQVVSEIQAAWAQVSGLAELLSLTIDTRAVNAALARLRTEKVDGYDLFMLESMKSNGLAQVITDDGDFVTAPGIQVFTANRNVIQAAKMQSKLIKR
jgi:predicted nucleic acid-binding protein